MERAIQTGEHRRWITMALVLGLIAVPVYQGWMRRTKERLLEHNRFALRVAMDEYAFDKQRQPRTMRDLVDAGYLRGVPFDPFAGKELTAPIPKQ